MTDRSPGDGLAGAYGANAWLVEEMYESYLADPESVSESWREFFTDYRSKGTTEEARELAGPEPSGAPRRAPSGRRLRVLPRPHRSPLRPVRRPSPLRGAAARVAENMSASLSVPTATSVHPVPAKLLEVNRAVINDQLGRTTGGKVSFTHLIAWAVVKALGAVPAMNSSFVEEVKETGTPGSSATSTSGSGSRSTSNARAAVEPSFVPCVRAADTLDFAHFVHAYEDLVRKVRTNKLSVDDFAGVTVTITNPGTLGTTQSVPRLMPGQGAIIGIGALGYPAEFAAADPEVLADLGMSKAVTLTSTYDHRIIQGAESGLFLTRVHELLVGEYGFYDEVFASLDIPYQPARWHKDVNPVHSGDGRPREAREASEGSAARQPVPGTRSPHGQPRPARDSCTRPCIPSSTR